MNERDKRIRAILDFMHKCNITDGKLIETTAVAYCDNNCIYDGKVKCYFGYDVSYMQYRITIEWEITDEIMHNLGLFGMYNTNFQKFIFEDNQLEIYNNNETIIYIDVVEKDNEQTNI